MPVRSEADEAGQDLAVVQDPDPRAGGGLGDRDRAQLVWLTSTGSASWARSTAGLKPSGTVVAGSMPWYFGAGPAQLPGGISTVAGRQSRPVR